MRVRRFPTTAWFKNKLLVRSGRRLKRELFQAKTRMEVPRMPIDRTTEKVGRYSLANDLTALRNRGFNAHHFIDMVLCRGDPQPLTSQQKLAFLTFGSPALSLILYQLHTCVLPARHHKKLREFLLTEEFVLHDSTLEPSCKPLAVCEWHWSWCKLIGWYRGGRLISHPMNVVVRTTIYNLSQQLLFADFYHCLLYASLRKDRLTTLVSYPLRAAASVIYLSWYLYPRRDQPQRQICEHYPLPQPGPLRNFSAPSQIWLWWLRCSFVPTKGKLSKKHYSVAFGGQKSVSVAWIAWGRETKTSTASGLPTVHNAILLSPSRPYARRYASVSMWIRMLIGVVPLVPKRLWARANSIIGEYWSTHHAWGQWSPAFINMQINGVRILIWKKGPAGFFNM